MYFIQFLFIWAVDKGTETEKHLTEYCPYKGEDSLRENSKCVKLITCLITEIIFYHTDRETMISICKKSQKNLFKIMLKETVILLTV